MTDARILAACMNGIEMQIGDEATSYLVDFIIQSSSGIVVALAGWWYNEGSATGKVSVYGTTELDENSEGWVLNRMEPNPPLKFSKSFSYQEVEDAYNDYRRGVDLDRDNYIASVRRLFSGIDMAGYDVETWINMIISRPEIDVVAEFMLENFSSRQIACFFLYSGDNELIDVLLLDERGTSSTAKDDSRTRIFADEWAFYGSNRPLFADYIKWVSGKTPYNAFWRSNEIIERGGNVDDIAKELFGMKSQLEV